MACEFKVWCMVCVLFLVSNLTPWVFGEPQVPCYFIFGDSLTDSGNNNNLETWAKANYQPYGVDFRYGPTGRFCNGRTIADVIAELLGFDNYIPPFASASGKDILKGTNYASGGAGIRNETGKQEGARIAIDGQLKSHQIIVSRIKNIIGDSDEVSAYLSKCIYLVEIGGNDYLTNYFAPSVFPSSSVYTPGQFAVVLIRQYSEQLRTLYKFGARKVALMALGPLGCAPYALAQFGTSGSLCVENINNAAQLFNTRLRSLVDELNSNLTDARFIYLNPFRTLLQDASSYGFRFTNVACCGSGALKCLPHENPCSNRTEYVFWDAFHLTEAANVIIGRKAYSAISPDDAYPLDIRRLAQL